MLVVKVQSCSVLYFQVRQQVNKKAYTEHQLIVHLVGGVTLNPKVRHQWRIEKNLINDCGASFKRAAVYFFNSAAPLRALGF